MNNPEQPKPPNNKIRNFFGSTAGVLNPRTQQIGAMVFGFIVIIAMTSMATVSILQTRKEQIKTEIGHLEAYARNTSEFTHQIFFGADTLLTLIEDNILEARVTTKEQLKKHADTQKMQDILQSLLLHSPELDAISIISHDGKFVNSTRGWPFQIKVDISKRDYFIALRDNPDTLIAISGGIKAVVNAQEIIVMGRRLSGPNGEFLGVATAVMPLARFEKLFAISSANTKHTSDTAALYREDGLLLTTPAGMTLGGEKSEIAWSQVRDGLSRSDIISFDTSTLVHDKPAHLVAISKIRGYPLIIGALLKKEKALESWWYLSSMLVLFVVAIAFLVILMVLTFLRYSKSNTEYMRRIFEDSGTGMAITAPDGQLIRVNRALCRILKRSNSDLIGKTIRELALPQPTSTATGEKNQTDLGISLNTADALEIEFPSDSNGSIWGLLSSSAVQDRGGAPLYHVVQIQDISQRKEAEEGLKRAQRLEAVGQLTGGIAHDFNNLLGVVIGNAEMARDIARDDRQLLLHIDTIIRSVERGSSLTHRLLAFSRRQALRPVLADISKTIGEFADMIRRTIGETVELSTDIPPDIWPVNIDVHQFENVLLNLSINARDAMPKGGFLKISAKNVTLEKTYSSNSSEDVPPGDYVKISVTDTGEGIPPDILSKVFEPFFTTKDVGKGSGLGLSMVYGFVKQTKGYVAISSTVDKGTQIEIFVLRAHGVVKNTDENRRHLERQNAAGRLLVVEDDRDLRRFIGDLLRQHGYEVLTATNGAEALVQLKGHGPFNLLLTDIVLPGGMNGIEIAETARHLQPDIKIILSSGYAESVVANAEKTAQFGGVMTKPYRSQDLIAKIGLLLDTSPGHA